MRHRPVTVSTGDWVILVPMEGPEVRGRFRVRNDYEIVVETENGATRRYRDDDLQHVFVEPRIKLKVREVIWVNVP